MIGNRLPANYHIDVDNLDKTLWSQLLTQFDDATIYQSWSYASVVYGKTNLSHLILKKDGNVVAMAQVGIRTIPILRLGIANVHWGPLWRKKFCEPDINHLSLIVRALKYEYAVKRSLLLRIWPNEIETSDRSTRSLWEEYGFRYNSEVPQYRTLKLDLTLPIDDLRKNLDQKWRNQLNRSQKNNLKVTEGNSDYLYKIFLQLQKEMHDRKKYTSGVDYHQYGMIQNDLPEFLKMKIILCEYEGEAVAASICSAIGDTGIYLLGATADKGLTLNGSNLLQWRMIEWLKARGCIWYDLGGIDPKINPGVYHFKRGLAGKIGKDESHLGQFELVSNIKTNILNNIINKRGLVRRILIGFRKFNLKYANRSG